LPAGRVIATVTVSLTLTHEFDSDLTIRLVAPDGTKVILANRVGDDGNGFIGTTFADNAPTSIAAQAAPFTGRFRPSEALATLIAGTEAHGVRIAGRTATANVLLGNRIGTDADGTGALGNGLDGVAILDAPANLVGGTEAGAGNLISGNDANGVRIEGRLARGN